MKLHRHVVMSHIGVGWLVLGQLREGGRIELLQNKLIDFSDEALERGR